MQISPLLIKIFTFTRLTQNVQLCIICSVTHIAYAAVAQSVEQWTENPCVDSSILSGGIQRAALVFGSCFFLCLNLCALWRILYK